MIVVDDPGGKTLKRTRILLLRHAETSAPDRFHGAESDVGLGARGFRQAEAVARVLALEQPAAVYSSAMLRARQTASIVARVAGCAVAVEPLLHERKMGPLSGLSRAEGLDSYTAAKARWMAGDLDHTHEGGESYATIQARVVPILNRLAASSAGTTIVVVAHGVVIRVALTSLLPDLAPEHFDRLAIDNTAINDLCWEGGTWSAVALNQKTHLDEGGDEFAW